MANRFMNANDSQDKYDNEEISMIIDLLTCPLLVQSTLVSFLFLMGLGSSVFCFLEGTALLSSK